MRLEGRFELLAFGGQAGDDFKLKPRIAQAFLDHLGDTPGGHLGADSTMRGHPLHGQGTPHLRVFERRKPIQIDRIKLAAQIFHRLLHVGHDQGQVHPTFCKEEGVKARQQSPVRRHQFLGQIVEFRPSLHAVQQVLGAHGVRLHAHVVQVFWGVGVLSPGLPSGQEIEPQTKTGLQNSPLGLTAPKGLVTQ